MCRNRIDWLILWYLRLLINLNKWRKRKWKFKFNEQEKIDSVNGALALRPQINEIVDEICERGYSNICWLGVGGTWASSMQATVHMKEMSAIETWAENAAEYLTTGNKRITKDTVVIISSVTGNTKEVVDAIKKSKQKLALQLSHLLMLKKLSY